MHQIHEYFWEYSVTYVELDLRDLRTLEGVRGKWVANLERPSFLREALEEFVIDAFLHEDT